MDLLNNLDALLVTNPTNIRYLTGFVGAAPEEREAYCLIAQECIYLFTNALYIKSTKQLSNSPIIQFSNYPIKVIEISREEPFAKKLNQILTGLNPVNQLGFEENNLTVAEYEKLKKELPGISLTPTQGRIEELRMIKRQDEIANIKAAAKITDQCFSYILEEIKPGVTESEIAWDIESFIKTHGADLAFSPIVAFGPNTSQPHYNPSKNGSLQQSKSNQSQALKLNDIILLDFGARVNGYCSDMTRIVFTGKPNAIWVNAYETVLQAQAVALEHLASSLPTDLSTEASAKGEASAKEGPGIRYPLGSKTDQFAREVIEKAGFPTYPHSLGHGVGLNIHEAPRLTMQNDAVLKPGMILTIEPGIYLEGQYGIRIEDLILLKEDGIEILSKSDKHIMVL